MDNLWVCESDAERPVREHVQYKVKTDVKEEQRKEGNLPDIELHQLHGHTLTETFHGKLRGSVNIIEHHS